MLSFSTLPFSFRSKWWTDNKVALGNAEKLSYFPRSILFWYRADESCLALLKICHSSPVSFPCQSVLRRDWQLHFNSFVTRNAPTIRIWFTTYLLTRFEKALTNFGKNIMVMDFYKEKLGLEHTRNVCSVSFGRLAGIIFAFCSNLSESLNIIRQSPAKISNWDCRNTIKAFGTGTHTGTPKIKIKLPNL